MKNQLQKLLLMGSKFILYGVFLQFFFFSILLANEGNAQKNKSVRQVYIDLQTKDATTSAVFSMIESSTDFKFFYDRKVINRSVHLSMDYQKASVYDILMDVSRQTGLMFKQINNTINVKKHINKEAPPENVVEITTQAVRVSGTVTSIEEDEPLPGVNIVEKGTNNGTVTDIDGKYTLEVTEGATLVFSSVGYLSEEIQVGNQTVINIQLTADIQTLQELVVVGYGAVKKSDLTGSVASVKAEELSAYPAISAVQALQGRAAGVQIQSTNGEPGAQHVVRIRGASSINADSDPIYVVDGFVGAALPPPEDIASIEILKDASATAIYGSRGANGVIMVTTKRGTPGKAKVDFNASYSMQEVINRLDLLNASQFQDYVQEAQPDLPQGTADTDWQDIIFQPGNIQNYQLSVSGGGEKMNYYISGIYFDQEGVVITSKYNRISLQSNMEVMPTDKMRFGANLLLRRNSRDGVRTQENSGGAGGTGVIASAFRFAPDLGIYNEDGTYTRNVVGEPLENPYAIAIERTDESVSDRMQANLFGEYDIFQDLSFKVTLGATTDNGRSGTYVPTTLNAGQNVGGDASVNGNRFTMFLNENYLTYSKEIADIHRFTVIGGYSYQKSHWESFGARGQSFISDAVSYWDLDGSTSWQRPSSSLTESELASWYGRVNYALFDRYLLTFNARYDGSSSFSKNYKWAFFPSGAIAWNITDEPFLQDVSWLSQLKLRASYGLTGNQAISPYQTLARFSADPAVIGGSPTAGVRPTSVANDELTWETTSQVDIGVDLGLFDDRINITADYYRKKTDDLLFNVPLPQYSGYSNQLKNIGSVENKGFEFAVSSNNLVGEFKWDMDFNISFNRNKILSLPEGNDIQYSTQPGHMVGTGNTQILREGEPVGVFYGFIYDGVYQEGDEFLPGGGFEQEAGGEKYRDINGTRDSNGDLTGVPDGVLNNDDRTVIGNPHPDFIWGWTNNFRWKGFDLNIFLQASQGNEIYSFSLMELGRMSGGSNATTRALDRWTPTHTDTDVPKVVSSRSYRPSTQWVFDGSYIRMKNLSLGYSLPQSLLETVKIRSLRIYVSAQNLFTITDYPGYDPEINYLAYNGQTRNMNVGMDYGSYPNAKSYTFGINLGF